jgi:hypothetical protein
VLPSIDGRTPPPQNVTGTDTAVSSFISAFCSRMDQTSVHGIALGNPEEGRVYQEVITNTDLFRGALERAARLDKQRSLLYGGAKYTSVGTATEGHGIGVLIVNRAKRFFLSVVSRRVPRLCHPLVHWVRFLKSNECVKLTTHSSSGECKNEWSFLHCPPPALKVS